MFRFFGFVGLQNLVFFDYYYISYIISLIKRRKLIYDLFYFVFPKKRHSGVFIDLRKKKVTRECVSFPD